ncbi:transcriptional regulator [Janthinobacterium sp. ROICE36]|nr:transcriptional regulator [Janthinobacterium sp. ROICE36]
MPPRSKPPSSLFGRRLREARLLVGIPQDRLGVAIGLDETTASARVSRYETGVHAPPVEIAARLAMVLNVPTPFLYCEDDELAEVIQTWYRLSNIERQRLLTLLRTKPDQS